MFSTIYTDGHGSWNMRYVDVGVSAGYNAVVDNISDPSQIPQNAINYFINSNEL